MRFIRILYYIFFVLFILLVVASSVIGIFFSPSPAKLKRLFPDPDYPITHNTYLYGGTEMDYYAIGPDTAQRILFLHGSPGSWDNFAELMAHTELYHTHRLIAIHRLGYGVSKMHAGVPDLDQQVESIMPMVQNSKGGRKPVLVGHSMGGPIVIRAAMLHSDRLKGVVSLAGSFDASLEPHEWYRGLYKVFPINLFMASPLKSSNDELFIHFKKLAAMQDDWKRITCPVYIFQGLSDNLVDKGNADYAEKKLAHLTDKKIIRIPNEDHFIPWEKDSLIAPYIQRLADQ